MIKVDFEEFNKNFFRKYTDKTNHFDRKIVVKLNKILNATITLEIKNTSGHYAGYLVKIIHKTNGVIDSKFFHFDDYLTKRVDNRSDYKNGFVIIESCCKQSFAKWYIAVPNDEEILKMAETIWSYIELWE